MANVDVNRYIPPNRWENESLADNSRDAIHKRVGDVKEFFDRRKVQLSGGVALDKKLISVIIDEATALLSVKCEQLSRAIEGEGADAPSIHKWCAERQSAVQRLEAAQSRLAELAPLQMAIQASRDYRGKGYWVVRAAYEEASSASWNLGSINGKISDALSGNEEICASIKSLENAVITDSKKIGVQVDRSKILFGDR